jgi:hypothetical protein
MTPAVNQARIYKQYGFVHYTVPEEAEAAINGMNNRIIVPWKSESHGCLMLFVFFGTYW